MTIKDISEARDNNKLFVGVKQAIKHNKDIATVFVAKDARSETIQKLNEKNISHVVLKSKEEIAKNLNLDFESEVFSIKK